MSQSVRLAVLVTINLLLPFIEFRVPLEWYVGLIYFTLQGLLVIELIPYVYEFLGWEYDMESGKMQVTVTGAFVGGFVGGIIPGIIAGIIVILTDPSVLNE